MKHPTEKTELVRTYVPRSMLEAIERFNTRLAIERKGPVSKAQTLRELLDLGLKATEEKK